MCIKQDTSTFEWKEGTEFNTYEAELYKKPVITKTTEPDEIKKRIEQAIPGASVSYVNITTDI